jgi:hypothetical protein
LNHIKFITVYLALIVNPSHPYTTSAMPLLDPPNELILNTSKCLEYERGIGVALQAASEGGHEAVVKMLVAGGAKSS